jgi:hypothetical protein
MNRRGYGTSADTSVNKDEIHPIWRGFGCVMLVIIPLMAFAAAVAIIDLNAQRDWFDIPAELNQLPSPDSLVAGLPAWIVDDFYAKLLVAVVCAVLFFGIFVIIYSLVYRMSGGYRSSPLDAPPQKRKTKKSR